MARKTTARIVKVRSAVKRTAVKAKAAAKRVTGQSMKYSEWKKDQLVKRAKRLGVKAPTTKTKEQLIREIKKQE